MISQEIFFMHTRKILYDTSNFDKIKQFHFSKPFSETRKQVTLQTIDDALDFYRPHFQKFRSNRADDVLLS